MKLQFWCAPYGMGLLVVFLGPVVEDASAREGRSGGGGYSRESPAAIGSLSSPLSIRTGTPRERAIKPPAIRFERSVESPAVWFERAIKPRTDCH
jgi:hypothetical protein